jgi:F0F1-type ATP synthase delta subunit
MAKAEMIIKIVMQPIHPASLYIEQYLKLLPESNLTEFHKILDMKNIKRVEHQQLVDLYKKSAPQSSTVEPAVPHSVSSNSIISIGDSIIDKGRIKKIENLIKNRLPN